MSFTIRRATEDDRAEIENVLSEYLHLPALDAARRYDWLYLGNPHGRALTWLGFDDESGALAGLTSLFQRRIVMGGVEAKGALGGDGYVRAAFRRRGLGRMLHQASRADMPKEGIRVMFGTPMAANVSPLTQAGARTIADTVRYVRPLKASALRMPEIADRLIPRLRRPHAGPVRLDPMEAGDRRVDELWVHTRGELGIATVRDAAFYTWRFLRSPSQQQKPFVIVDCGRPIAACALEWSEDRLRIVDFLAPNENWGRAFGAMAGVGNGCAILEIRLLKEDGEARWMWRHGFLARDKKPLNLLLPPDEPAATVLVDPKRWYFTSAESDMDHA